MTVSDHLIELGRLALAGDEMAIRTLACMRFLKEAKDDPGPDGGCEIINLSHIQLKRAA